MGCLKFLCYASSAIHFILTLLLSIGTIMICVWYKDPTKIDETYGVHDTPFWLWVIVAIYCVFAFISTIALMRGIAVENAKLLKSFFSNMIVIWIFVVIRALITMIRQIQNHHSAGSVASEFFGNIAVCIFSVICMIPCFMLYTKMAGESYFQGCIDCCPCLKVCCPCCRDKHRASRVPSYQV